MTKRSDRSPRDAAGIGPHVRSGVRLTPLRELEKFTIAEGEADIRGWEVQTVSGREVGKISDLLVDTTTDEVVMLDVDLAGSDRHTLAPVRAAQLDRGRRVVVIDSADLRDVADFPSLHRNAPLTDDEARLFGQRYDAAYGDRGWSQERDWRVRRGGDELRFHRRAADLGAGASAGAPASGDTRADREVSYDRDVRDEPRADAASREDDVVDIDEARRARDARRDVRYASGDEVVVEQRPVVVEEVIVRRRVVDAADQAVDDEDIVRAAMDPNSRRDASLRRSSETERRDDAR
jgi:hypothetical protein